MDTLSSSLSRTASWLAEETQEEARDWSEGLEFEDVTVTLPAARKTPPRVLVDRARGRAARGGVLAILGPSGAGKTSLLSALGREVPCEGKIRRPPGVVNVSAPAS